MELRPMTASVTWRKIPYRLFLSVTKSSWYGDWLRGFCRVHSKSRRGGKMYCIYKWCIHEDPPALWCTFDVLQINNQCSTSQCFLLCTMGHCLNQEWWQHKAKLSKRFRLVRISWFHSSTNQRLWKTYLSMYRTPQRIVMYPARSSCCCSWDNSVELFISHE